MEPDELEQDKKMERKQYERERERERDNAWDQYEAETSECMYCGEEFNGSGRVCFRKECMARAYNEGMWS